MFLVVICVLNLRRFPETYKSNMSSKINETFMKNISVDLLDASDAPRVTVDKLYLSHHSQLTLELVCSARANPTASITWSRLEPDTGAWVELIEDPTETGVWTVDRQVMT